MLRKLVQLDFTSFDDYLDWNFDLEDDDYSVCIEEEVEEEVCYKCESKKPFSLERVLELVQRIDLGNMMQTHHASFFRSLREFCHHHAQFPASRTRDLNVKDMTRADLMTLFCALPRWQARVNEPSVVFCFEIWSGLECADFDDAWDYYGSQDVFAITHKTSGVCAFWADDTSIVAATADDLAKKFRDCAILRVLLRSNIKINADTAENVFTLWIDGVKPDTGPNSKISCASCSLLKHRSDYSKSQLKKATPRCIRCIDAVA